MSAFLKNDSDKNSEKNSEFDSTENISEDNLSVQGGFKEGETTCDVVEYVPGSKFSKIYARHMGDLVFVFATNTILARMVDNPSNPKRINFGQYAMSISENKFPPFRYLFLK